MKQVKIKIETSVEATLGDKPVNEIINSLQKMYELEKPPALEFCGTPPDGKARRREKRKLERLKNKKQ